VKEAIRQHKKGSLVTICRHAVPPTADEPVTFQPPRKVAADSLESIQGQLTDEQFKELLTPGTRLYIRWARQVDSVAVYLKQLQDAGVPVLWRPYHEMNGDWFWWGGRVGEYSSADLYRQLFDRYVNYHKLTNLIWVWNVDRPSTPIRIFSNFYPGSEYLDILSLDVYGSDFNQAYYDSLMVLSKGKPLLFGEVGNPPSPEILETQPN
jgi:mannan endo-1,4-beta-mannosidase